MFNSKNGIKENIDKILTVNIIFYNFISSLNLFIFWLNKKALRQTISNTYRGTKSVYKCIRKLGEGAQAVVYHVIDETENNKE